MRRGRRRLPSWACLRVGRRRRPHCAACSLPSAAASGWLSRPNPATEAEERAAAAPAQEDGLRASAADASLAGEAALLLDVLLALLLATARLDLPGLRYVALAARTLNGGRVRRGSVFWPVWRDSVRAMGRRRRPPHTARLAVVLEPLYSIRSAVLGGEGDRCALCTDEDR